MTAGTDAVRLDWSAKSQPTSVFVSSDPDAQPAFMRPLKAGVRGGQALLPLAVAPRPYLLLRTADAVGNFRPRQRVPTNGGDPFVAGDSVRMRQGFRDPTGAGLPAVLRDVRLQRHSL